MNLHFCYAQFLKTTPQSQFQLNIGALSCAAVNSYDSVVGKTPACQQAASDLSQKKTTFASFVLMCLCTISQNYLRISRSSNCRVTECSEGHTDCRTMLSQKVAACLNKSSSETFYNIV